MHEALDTTTGQRVALKQLQRFESDGLLRFKREFRALADIRHENLVRFGELVSEDDEWFFTMELVEGVPLHDYVMAEGDTSAGGSAFRFRFDEARLKASFSQLVEGVHAIHCAGMLHRDLKPPNVLVTKEGRVVILDFGLVVHLGADDATRSTQVVGTPAYMSPEQAQGKGAGTPSDWYAVGLMLFEALTGELPFKGGVFEMIVQRHTEDPARPSTLDRSLPKELDDLCYRLIARDPEARPSYEELSRAFGSQPPRPPTPQIRTAGEIFVGRTAELARLREAFQTVKDGGAAQVLVGGPSGIGKTSLIKHFLDEIQAEDRRALLLRGRCYRSESVPYKAFDGLMDDLTDHLTRLETAEAARFLPRDWPARPPVSRAARAGRAGCEPSRERRGPRRP